MQSQLVVVMVAVAVCAASVFGKQPGMPSAQAAPKVAPKAAPTAPSSAPAQSQPVENSATKPVPREQEGWQKLHASFNERAKEGNEMGGVGMVFIGDSITQGWGGAGKAAWEEYYAKRGAVNMGIGGDRTQHVIWRVQNGNLDGLADPKPEDAKPPRLAVVMIGTNNMGDNTPEEIAEGVKEVVAAIRQKLPTSKVLLLGILPRREKPDDVREKVAQTNRLIAPLADGKTVHYLDTGARFVQNDGTISAELMPDFLHLSPRGYELWASWIEPKVKELMGD